MQNKIPKKTIVWALFAGVILLCCGGVIGWSLHRQDITTFTAVRQVSPSYKFIDPLLFIQNPESDSFPKYSPLKKSIAAYTDQVTSENKVTAISVYFRDLNQNKWIGINPDKKFSPASMLKVFTIIGVLREAESDASLLSKEITVPPVPQSAQEQDYYAPHDPIKMGGRYTVQELLYHLIIESDNIANYTLINLIGESKLEEAYKNLQLPVPDLLSSDAITAQQYSHLFRILFSGTFLSHDLSEQVLDLLSRTEFTEGLVAGVPKGTEVSHKFGERTFTPADSTSTNSTGDTGTHELHDCGIVYYPDHPYFLCVMTKGNDFDSLSDVLKNVSMITWNGVSALYPR